MRQIDIEGVKKYLTEELKNEIERRGFKRGVVGVSGGLDSAVAVTLLSLSVGRENTVGVILPYNGMGEEELKDAVAIIKNLGVKSYRIDIQPMVDDYFKNFPDADKKRRGNKMARERMSILYDISALENALVIGTGNKTEVRQLASCIGVPDKIIKKVPTAGLWKGQTDEGELGYEYNEIDNLLYHIIELKHSRKKLLDVGFEEKFVDDITGRIKNTEFKRILPLIITIPEQVKHVHKYQ